jgi:hypothetical protein
MLQDPAFFTDVPAFAFLQPNAVDAIAAANAAKSRGACASCGDVWRYFRPVVDAVMLLLPELIATKAEALDHIRAYLTRKKRYDVTAVVIYYRGSNKGSIKKLTF